jgi:hypothetical protein
VDIGGAGFKRAHHGFGGFPGQEGLVAVWHPRDIDVECHAHLIPVKCHSEGIGAIHFPFETESCPPANVGMTGPT